MNKSSTSQKTLTTKSSKELKSSSLKVSVYWGDILYGTLLCKPNESVTVGRAGSNTFVLDLENTTGKRSIEVLKVNADNTADLRFDDSIDGHVKLGGKLLSLSSVRQDQHLQKDSDGIYHLQLHQNEKADMVIGLVSFYFDWVDSIEVLPRKETVDQEERKKWWIAAIATVLIPFLFFVLPLLIPPAEPERPPERLVTLMPRQAPAKAAMGERGSDDGGAQKGEAGKAAVKAEEKPSAAQQLKRSNIGSLLSGLTSMGANAPSAPSQNAPKAAVAQVGTGGFSTEGLKTGGGGQTVGIGRQVGRGQGGFEGTGRLGLSGDSAVEGSTGNGGPDTLVKGGLSRDVIEAIIRRRQYRIRLCYERQLNFNPKLAGKITIHFVIGKKGEVLKSEATEDTMKSDAVKQCVLTEVKTWNFPPPEGGTVVDVDYPFVFESSAHTGQ